MSKLILYHGSSEIIEKPILGKGKTYNDYGQGFYCTENLELAKEWACTEGIDGYANQYEIEIDKMHILNLSSETYHILHWLALLITYRKLRLSTPIMKRGRLGEQFVLKTEKAFDAMHFISAVSADNTIYYTRRKARDEEARSAYFAEHESEVLNGIYMRDILRGEVGADALRL